MIRHLNHTEIDKARWDQCIAASDNELLYAYSWFLDIIAPGWNALVMGDYEMVMPLPWRKKWGIAYVYQPFFTQQLGIFGKELSQGSVPAFLKEIPSCYRYIDMYLNEQNSLEDKSFVIEPRKTQFLDLSASYADLYSNYDPKLRRNLRRASECDFSIRTIGPSDIVSMFRDTQGMKLGLFAERDYATLHRMLETAVEKGLADNTGVYTAEGELCASACFINTSGRVMYFKSSSTEAGKRMRAMHWLMDHYIREKAGSGKVFDFGGSVIPSIENYYKSFGAQDHIYLHVRKNRLPWPLRWLKN